MNAHLRERLTASLDTTAPDVLDMARAQLFGLLDYGRKYKDAGFVEGISTAIGVLDRLGAADPATRAALRVDARERERVEG